MIVAASAPVRPRFLSSATGASLPLEDEVRRYLDEGWSGSIQLVGGPGSGKSTALAHLAALFGKCARLRLIDGAKAAIVGETLVQELVVYAGFEAGAKTPIHTFNLAPWTRDEFIEYLLAVRPERCSAVIRQLTPADQATFGGVPEIWRVVLDRLAADSTLKTAGDALVGRFRVRLANDLLCDQVQAACLGLQLGQMGRKVVLLATHPGGIPLDLICLLRHRGIRRLLAAECLARNLQDADAKVDLSLPMRRDFVRTVAGRMPLSSKVLFRLNAEMRRPVAQPMAASLLHAIDPSWIPAGDRRLHLQGAHLDYVCWPRIELRGVELCEADLSGADLRGACLDGGNAEKANLSEALLQKASLNELNAAGANLRGADLSGVCAEWILLWGGNLNEAKLDNALLTGAMFTRTDLRGASFRRARLAGADFQRATFGETDFTEADLTKTDLSGGLDLHTSCLSGACLRNARLTNGDLEGMSLDGVDLSGADLEGALLTGTSLIGGNLADACLRCTGLADIDWEGVCLRGANLSGATFHMGSSRSGLVSSVIASEGTRTGFYTDDFTEQDFKAPEEIRKANLRNADLRYANVNGVDFYLVDLRGALYDEHQAEHFRRCGAILEDRCPS